MDKHATIYIAGHTGLVGSAMVRHLRSRGFDAIITRTRQALDLRQQSAVAQFFQATRPEYVILAAARVGGIQANSAYPGDFIGDNLQIQTNVIDSAYRAGTKKLLFLGSSCIYPRDCPQPIKEDYLLTGPLEATNQWYAIAKIAGIKMCQAYRQQHGFNAICAMPTNLYGPEDNFDLHTSHVLPALIRKFYQAKADKAAEVIVWGSGRPRREFLHVDDLAAACLYLLAHYDDEGIINVGTGKDISIAELAGRIKAMSGYRGRIVYDTSKADGTPQKRLDTRRLEALGWRAGMTLTEGLHATWCWYVNSRPSAT